MLDTLPTELTLKILDFSKVIEASKPILPPSSNSKQTILCPWCWTTIASLSLTCRTLRQITLPTLFSTLTIFPDAKYPQRLGLPDIAPEGHAAVDITALEWLDAFVRKADSLCNQLVQTLDVCLFDAGARQSPWLERLVLGLPNLRCIDFGSSILGPHLGNPSLLYSFDFESIESVLRARPLLTRITFKDMYFDWRSQISMCFHRGPKAFEKVILKQAHLYRCQLALFDRVDILWANMIKSAMTIKELYVHGDHDMDGNVDIGGHPTARWSKLTFPGLKSLVVDGSIIGISLDEELEDFVQRHPTLTRIRLQSIQFDHPEYMEQSSLIREFWNRVPHSAIFSVSFDVQRKPSLGTTVSFACVSGTVCIGVDDDDTSVKIADVGTSLPDLERIALLFVETLNIDLDTSFIRDAFAPFTRVKSIYIEGLKPTDPAARGETSNVISLHPTEIEYDQLHLNWLSQRPFTYPLLICAFQMASVMPALEEVIFEALDTQGLDTKREIGGICRRIAIERDVSTNTVVRVRERQWEQHRDMRVDDDGLGCVWPSHDS